MLPDLEKCQQILTLGPNGDSVENVNGRAASIEFFLDLSYGSVPPPTVRWTCYDQKQDAYQGELVDKEILLMPTQKTPKGVLGKNVAEKNIQKQHSTIE